MSAGNGSRDLYNLRARLFGEETNQNLPPNRLSYCFAPSSSLSSVKAERRETLNIKPGYSSQQSMYQSSNHQFTGNTCKIDETGYNKQNIGRASRVYSRNTILCTFAVWFLKVMTFGRTSLAALHRGCGHGTLSSGAKVSKCFSTSFSILFTLLYSKVRFS